MEIMFINLLGMTDSTVQVVVKNTDGVVLQEDSCLNLWNNQTRYGGENVTRQSVEDNKLVVTLEL